MSDIFGKIKSGASKAAKEAEKAARIQRIEMDIGGLRRKIDDHYKNLGEATYNVSVGGEAGKQDSSTIIAAITDLKKQIAAKEDEIKALKEDAAAPPSAEPTTTSEPTPASAPSGKRFCTNCGKEADPNSKFCADCGNKLD